MSNFVLSYTSYSDFKLCPKRFYHKHIVRDYPFETSEHLVWGRDVHSAFERRLNPPYIPFPMNMSTFEPFARTLLEFPVVHSEQGLAVSRSGEPLPWSARPALLKAKADIDVMNTGKTHALLIDIKTGKIREDPTELQFQAVVLKARYPTLESIQAAYYWTRESRLGKKYDVGSDILTTTDTIKSAIDAIEALTLCTDPRSAFKATPSTPFPCDHCICPGCKFANGKKPSP